MGTALIATVLCLVALALSCVLSNSATANLLVPIGISLALLLVSTRRARNLVRWLRHQGYRSHLAADDWAGGLTGGVMVGSRSAVWA